MQLGTRWNVFAEPQAKLTDDVRAAIATVEAELDGLDVADWRWTLTWLEARPVLELDDGTVIHVAHDGSVHITGTEGD